MLQKSYKIGRVCVAASAFVALVACHTIGGAGRDVSSVGNAVTSGVSSATPR